MKTQALLALLVISNTSFSINNPFITNGFFTGIAGYYVTKGVCYGTIGLAAKKAAQALGANIRNSTNDGYSGSHFDVGNPNPSGDMWGNALKVTSAMAIDGSVVYATAQVTSAAGTGVAAASAAALSHLPAAAQAAITTASVPVMMQGAAAVGMIEALSLKVGAVLTACWWLP